MPCVSGPLVRYILMSAIRDRLILSLIVLLMLGASISMFMGSSAMIEADQFSLVFAAGGLRIAALGGLILFIVFHVRRSFDTKDVDFLLSRPISRTSFILSHSLAFSLLAIVIGAAAGIAICIVNPVIIHSGHALWAFSLIVELVIMANAALFFSMVVSSAAGSALAVFGLYVLSRLMGQLLGISSVSDNMFAYPLLQAGMKAVSMVVPRLDLMAQTSWLIYPNLAQISYGFIAIQGVAYVALLIVAALIDLRRRQF
jgi:hypothetical protein